MTSSDRERWNNKWDYFGLSDASPDRLLAANADLLPGGLALDVACGQGRNSVWLAQRGYRVIGLDLSDVGLRQAQTTAAAANVTDRIDFVQIDLDNWRPPPAVCDLIIVFRFLDRRLFPHLRAALKPGGLIVYETRHLGALAVSPQSDPRYLLEPGELAREFADWQTIYAAELAQSNQLIARKPGKNITQSR